MTIFHRPISILWSSAWSKLGFSIKSRCYSPTEKSNKRQRSWYWVFKIPMLNMLVCVLPLYDNSSPCRYILYDLSHKLYRHVHIHKYITFATFRTFYSFEGDEEATNRSRTLHAFFSSTFSYVFPLIHSHNE